LTRSARLAAASVTFGLPVVLFLGLAGSGWSQQAPQPKADIPQFPPGPGYAGVAGTAAENARITALCGPNRNATDGYSPPPAVPGQTKAPLVKGTQGYAVESVAKIDRPWGMAFLPDGKMLISFRDGGMRTVDAKGAVSDLLAGVPEIYQKRLGTGMYGLILDKDFAHNRTIYFGYHTKAPSDAAAMGRIASAELSKDEKSLENVKVLREGADIQPRAIVQAKDGTLLIASADITDTGVNTQKLNSQLGKILRIGTDGKPPQDNPYITDLNANQAVWAQGPVRCGPLRTCRRAATSSMSCARARTTASA
jgi:glucose/arabinose dehydrogenase